jgi:type VI secretion system secreted protein Hcp
VVFKRDLPPEMGVQENQTSKPSEVQLPGKTVDHQTAYADYGVVVLLNLTGIQGESVIQDHEGEIDVLAWSWEISNQGGGGVGKAIVGPLTVTKFVDKASPLLILATLKGSIFSEAIIVARKTGKDALDYLKITMSGVRVTNVSNGGVSGENNLTESVTLVFSKVCYEYISQKERCWDIKKNTKF